MEAFSPSDKSGSFAHWVERNGDLMDMRSGDGGGCGNNAKKQNKLGCVSDPDHQLPTPPVDKALNFSTCPDGFGRRLLHSSDEAKKFIIVITPNYSNRWVILYIEYSIIRIVMYVSYLSTANKVAVSHFAL